MLDVGFFQIWILHYLLVFCRNVGFFGLVFRGLSDLNWFSVWMLGVGFFQIWILHYLLVFCRNVGFFRVGFSWIPDVVGFSLDCWISGWFFVDLGYGLFSVWIFLFFRIWIRFVC